MVRMPVSTLRIWERRYQVVAPGTTASGHRLYTAADVERLALLKQLTDHGHAIGAIAALDMAALHQVASTHATTVAGGQIAASAAPVPWRLLVVGAALARRLQRPALRQALRRNPDLVAVFDDLALAHQAASDKSSERQTIDLLLWHTPSPQAGDLAALSAAQRAWGAAAAVVVYRFAGASARQALVDAGLMLLREPLDDETLGLCLRGLSASAMAADGNSTAQAAAPDAAGWAAGAVAPRRFDDAALMDFAGLSSTVACECPRHVAELLLQLSNFEAYSADCEDRSPADAALHAHLKQVAGASRALFESALERVARHEGLVMPAERAA